MRRSPFRLRWSGSSSVYASFAWPRKSDLDLRNSITIPRMPPSTADSVDMDDGDFNRNWDCLWDPRHQWDGGVRPQGAQGHPQPLTSQFGSPPPCPSTSLDYPAGSARPALQAHTEPDMEEPAPAPVTNKADLLKLLEEKLDIRPLNPFDSWKKQQERYPPADRKVPPPPPPPPHAPPPRPEERGGGRGG